MGRIIELFPTPDAIEIVPSLPGDRLNGILAARKGPNLRQKGIKTLEAKDPFAMKIGVAGYVYVDLIDAKTGIIKRHLEFPNLITTAFLNALGTNTAGTTFMAAWLTNGWIGVGTGNATPTNADTGLQSPTGVRTQSQGGGTSTTGAGAANAYWFSRTVREFSEAQSNGNLTEFGMFNASSSGTMLCRQLFKDVGGTPTEIVKTSADKLRITYEFRLYPPTVDGSGGPVSINAVNYNWTSRAANIGTDTAWGSGGSATGLLNHLGDQASNSFIANSNNGTALGAATGSITGATQSANMTSSTKTAYVADSFYVEWTAIWDPGAANFSPGVRGFNFQPFSSSSSVSHQLLLSAAIPKVNTQRLTMVFRLAFDRHTI